MRPPLRWRGWLFYAIARGAWSAPGYGTRRDCRFPEGFTCRVYRCLKKLKVPPHPASLSGSGPSLRRVSAKRKPVES
jgi:hypothetical protein